MLIFQKNLTRSITTCLEPIPKEFFSERETLYFKGLAKPEGSMAARFLMKELLMEFFHSSQMSHPPATFEILPEGFSNTQATTGPPSLHFVHENPFPGLTFHLSMSHSATQAMAALLVLQEEYDGTDSIR
jgi:phosphopantetheinyl transferase (holo-ACP synthase)